MHRVFVYGSLKKGFSNHRVIHGAKFLGDDTTLEDAWFMFSMGGFPGVVSGNGYISGEVYEVDDEVLKDLDRLEGNGNFYTREVVELANHEQAWMYILPDYDIRDSQEGVKWVGPNQTWVESSHNYYG